MKTPVYILIFLVFSLSFTPAQAVAPQPSTPSTITNHYPYALASLTISAPDGDVQIPLSGTAEEWLNTTPAGDASDTDGNGLEQITTQLNALNLNGSSTLGAVQVTVRSSSKSPFQDSLGEMEEQINNSAGVLDLSPFTFMGTVSSFFDIFLEVTIAGTVYHNEQPWHITGIFKQTPSLPGEYYLSQGDVQLYDSSYQGTRYNLDSLQYYPNPWLVMAPMVVR
jgi:hypothetical protein